MVSLDPTQSGWEARALDTALRERIVGQDEAVEAVVGAYQIHLAGMAAPGRPVGNFLFLGPTGTGKTRLVEALAEVLVGQASAVVKVNCAEFQHSHEIAKLVGSPPGYLGHRETHPMLSQERLDRYHTERVKLSFVLFDEIEKASDALWSLLLGILDKAQLTLGDNREVDFSRVMIFMTSNLGGREISDLSAGTYVGFVPSGNLEEKIETAGLQAARKKFTPEFMNRIDKTVVFRALDAEALRRILDLELGRLRDRVPFWFEATPAAKAHLLAEGTDGRYGARHLKRAIERILVYPFAALVATEQVVTGDHVQVGFSDGRVTFERDQRRVEEAA